ISVFGLCSGGNAAWEYTRQHPGRFAAMVAGSATPPSAAKPEDFVQTAVWVFNNEDDTAPYEVTQTFIETINASGGNAFLTLKKFGGHDSWTNALAKDKVVGWMILQDLEKGGPPSAVICFHRTPLQVFGLFGVPAIAIISILCVIGLKNKKINRTSDET
ncbi:MAG: hypothetical protein ACRC2T_06190, partial [Thermoguttaceae bacterium]